MPVKSPKNKVALIYADGQIVDGESYPGAVGGATLADQIAQAREDNGVKAVVLRVNSWAEALSLRMWCGAKWNFAAR